MTFAERLEYARLLYAAGLADRAREAPKANGRRDYGIGLGGLGRAALASYWLGATERDRVRSDP